MAASAPLFDMGSQMGWLNRNGWGVKFNYGIKTLAFSRDLLGWSLRLIAKTKQIEKNTIVRG